MSWSVNLIGLAPAIKTALAAHVETLTGQSRVEYEEAMPHLIALVGMNEPGQFPAVLQLDAYGSAGFNQVAGVKTYSNCFVNIRTTTGKIVT